MNGEPARDGGKGASRPTLKREAAGLLVLYAVFALLSGLLAAQCIERPPAGEGTQHESR